MKDEFKDPTKLNDFDRLWAPHRRFYAKERTSSDPLDEVYKLSDEDGLIVARGEFVYIVLNLYPYNPGHCMVVPYRNIPDLEDLTTEEILEMMTYTQKIIKVLKKVSNPAAFNVGFNLGRGAGGSITEHIHQHVVPRWIGDSSFITVLDNTKIMVQVLRDTRQLLADAWKEFDN